MTNCTEWKGTRTSAGYPQRYYASSGMQVYEHRAVLERKLVAHESAPAADDGGR